MAAYFYLELLVIHAGAAILIQHFIGGGKELSNFY